MLLIYLKLKNNPSSFFFFFCSLAVFQKPKHEVGIAHISYLRLCFWRGYWETEQTGCNWL